jgi:hypothetical protein
MIRLEIPRVPTSPNGLYGVHWRHRHRHTNLWRLEVQVALHNSDQRPDKPYLKAHVIIDRRSSGRLDPDNLVASVKPVIDALRYSHVLVNDTADHITLVVTQSQTRTLPARTLIEVTPIEETT